MADGCPDISVVIGAHQARSTVAHCLQSVLAQIHGLHAEIIVAAGTADGTADFVAREFPAVTLLRGSHRQLVPDLWAMGIEHARAPLVAITIAQCVPGADWVPALLRVANEYPHVAALGGPIDGPHGGSPIDWAVYFARYTAHMPGRASGDVRDVAGDNALYRREALQSAWTNRRFGFWETLVHHKLRVDGRSIRTAPTLMVQLMPASGRPGFASIRFRHGRHFASTRSLSSGAARVLRIVSTPLLPVVLLFRIGRSVWQRRRDWMGHYLRSIPWLIVFLTAWSLGEAVGYLAPRLDDGRQ